MAQGRMLRKEIANSEKLGSLRSDKARVLYFMMLPHLDIGGRLIAHPRIIKGQITTMLGYSEKAIQDCLEQLHAAGLIVLYQIKSNQYLQYARFEDFQTLNPSREAQSTIPGPTQDNSRVLQRTPYKVKLSKDKISKDKYIEYVFLTKAEYEKLLEKFGKTKTATLIEDLNNGIGSKGYKYKSHYHTILAWERKNQREKQQDELPFDTKAKAQQDALMRKTND